MRNSKFYHFLADPFEDMGANKQLLVGIFSVLIGLFVCYVGRLQFYGLLKITAYSNISLLNSSFALLISLLITVSFLYLYAWVENKKTRFLDCLNVVLVAVIPLYVLAALTALEPFSVVLERIIGAIQSGDLQFNSLESKDVVIMSVLAFLSIFVLLYFFYLVVIGIKTAMNGKKVYQGFVIALLVLLADGWSKIIIQFIY